MIAAIKEQIQQAISRSDSQQIRKCFYTLKGLMLAGTNFEQQDFRFFIDLLKQKHFLEYE